MKMYDLDSKIDFGMYYGLTLNEIFEYRSDYILWCFTNLEKFCVTDEVFNKLHPIKQYNISNTKFLETGELKDKNKALQFQHFHDSLQKLQTIKTNFYKTHEEKIKLAIESKLKKTQKTNYNREDRYDYDHHYNYYDNYDPSIDAAGTDDPTTLNDVYWNID